MPKRFTMHSKNDMNLGEGEMHLVRVVTVPPDDCNDGARGG